MAWNAKVIDSKCVYLSHCIIIIFLFDSNHVIYDVVLATKCLSLICTYCSGPLPKSVIPSLIRQVISSSYKEELDRIHSKLQHKNAKDSIQSSNMKGQKLFSGFSNVFNDMFHKDEAKLQDDLNKGSMDILVALAARDNILTDDFAVIVEMMTVAVNSKNADERKATVQIAFLLGERLY